MNAAAFTQLGVAGVICLLLFYITTVLWKDNQTLREQARQDQQAVLPALAQASTAMAEFARVAALLRDRG